MGTQIYIKITKKAARDQRMVSGIVTLLSSMSILARDALPVRVAAVLASRYYFCTQNISRVMHSSTTAMAAAPSLS